MEWPHIFRRILHLVTPIFLIFYFLPSPLWQGGPSREMGLIFCLAIVLIFEAVRLSVKRTVVGMREYENKRLASYAWASVGMTLLFLTVPLEVAAPIMVAWAWMDPLIGELRWNKSKYYPSIPTALYFIIVLSILTYFFGPDIRVLIISVILAPIAIWIERQRWYRMDDDFTFQVYPGLILFAYCGLVGLI